MPSASALAVENQLRRARTELEEGLRALADTRAEGLLAAYPVVAADPEAALELVYTEFVVREQLGQNPNPADWYTRFPQWKNDLEQMFEVHRELNKADSLRKSRAAAVTFPAVPVTDDTARRIGEFELLGEVGRGGMGVVYKAHQPSLGRVVAVKVILAGAHAGGRERERFRREAETAAKLDHPNVVRIFAVGEHDGRPFCAMEFVDGASLADLLDGRPWPTRRAAELVVAVAAAAQHAHENGVIHRDLKPANILLVGARKEGKARPTEADRTPTTPPSAAPLPVVKVVDFGLAKSLLDTDRGPTRTGDLIGTPAYMSPEQASAMSTIGPPTDVWGIGVTLYELLVGHPPFQGASSVETLQQVREVEPMPPRRLRPAVPRDLEVICLKCLRKDPKHRYPSAAALADDLSRFLRGEPIRARPVSAVEHVSHWCRRNPAVSALLGVMLTLLGGGLIAFAALWQRADTERGLAVSAGRQEALARQEADRVRQLEADARTEANERLYASQITQASLDIAASRTRAAERTLDECRETNPDRCGWEWYYLKRKCQTHAVEMVGHKQPVNTLAYSPDGKWLVSGAGYWNGTEDGEVKLWHAKTGKLARPLTGPKGTVHRVAFHPKGEWVAAACMDGTIYRWNPDRPDESVTRIPCSVDGVYSFAVHPDGRTLAAGLSSGAVLLLDAGTGKLIRHHAGHGQNVYDVAFSPDGTAVASTCRDGRVTVRATDTFDELHQLYLPSDARRVLFTPDDRFLVTASYDGEVTLWDRANGYRRAASHHLGRGELTNIQCRPDATQLACGTRSHGLKVWAIRGQDELPTPNTSGCTQSVAYSPDSRWLATARDDAVIRVFDTAPPADPRALAAHSSWVTSLSLSPDGRTVALAAGVNWSGGPGAKTIRLVSLRDGAARPDFRGHTDWLTAVAFHPNGRQLLSADQGGAVKLWDVEGGRVERPLVGHTGAVHAAAYHPAGELAVTAGADGTARLWSLADGTQAKSLPHPRGVLSVAFSTDGNWLATGCADGRVRVWAVGTGDLAHELTGHQAPVVALAFQPNTTVVASADEDHSLRFWGAGTGALLSTHASVRPTAVADDREQQPKGTPSRREIHLAYSPDGRRLAVGADRALQVWDATARRLLLVLELAENGLNHHVAFTTDGAQLLVASTRSVFVWDSVPTPPPPRPDSPAETNAPVYERLGLAAARSRDWYAVEYYADAMVRLQPASAFWLARRGMARQLRGKTAEADADHRQALVLAAANEKAKAAETAGVWTQRGEAFAKAGRWAEAEEAYRESTRYTPTVGFRWQNVGECRLARGDLAGYFECCKEVLKRFDPSRPLATLGVITYTLASAPQEGNRAKFLELAKLPAATFNNREREYAAILYRAGNYRESLTQCRNTQASAFRLRAWDMLFRSMAHHQLKQPDDAREWLGKARDWIAEADRVAVTPTAWGDFTWSEWNEEVQVRTLLTEAESLINGPKGTHTGCSQSTGLNGVHDSQP